MYKYLLLFSGVLLLILPGLTAFLVRGAGSSVMDFDRTDLLLWLNVPVLLLLLFMALAQGFERVLLSSRHVRTNVFQGSLFWISIAVTLCIIVSFFFWLLVLHANFKDWLLKPEHEIAQESRDLTRLYPIDPYLFEMRHKLLTIGLEVDQELRETTPLFDEKKREHILNKISLIHSLSESALLQKVSNSFQVGSFQAFPGQVGLKTVARSRLSVTEKVPISSISKDLLEKLRPNDLLLLKPRNASYTEGLFLLKAMDNTYLYMRKFSKLPAKQSATKKELSLSVKADFPYFELDDGDRGVCLLFALILVNASLFFFSFILWAGLVTASCIASGVQHHPE